MNQISFNVLAQRELFDAARYYELESTGLGATFLAEVERALNQILENPEAAPELVSPVRRRMLRRFPYAVLYRPHPDGIRVLAIMNLKRRPSYWVGRS